MAYLNGEVDQNPVVNPGHGPKSRLELRTKQPTIYLACRLFFEEGSPAHANPNIFSASSLNTLGRMVNQSPQWTEAHYPILEIYKAWQTL